MTDDQDAPPRAGEFVEKTKTIGRDAKQVADDIHDLYETASTRMNLRQVYQDNPLLVLGIAAGVGYIVGGGLFSPFTSRLVKYGARALVVPMLSAQMKQVIGDDSDAH